MWQQSQTSALLVQQKEEKKKSDFHKAKTMEDN